MAKTRNRQARLTEAIIKRLPTLLIILVLASVMLAPVMMFFDFDPMPGDFAFTFDHQHFQVPVLWTLCAGVGLTLLYSVLKK